MLIVKATTSAAALDQDAQRLDADADALDRNGYKVRAHECREAAKQQRARAQKLRRTRAEGVRFG